MRKLLPCLPPELLLAPAAFHCYSSVWVAFDQPLGFRPLTAALPGLSIAAAGAGLFLGCAAAEIWVLLDEAAFAAEAGAINPPAPYYRARRWPNGNDGLMFDPVRRFWATD